ncbi:MAG: hypothetical protein L3J72_05145, partial [Thermoplasmata archaeon]|nr:hypothetical protein [Thermoplasmata archaeon]
MRPQLYPMMGPFLLAAAGCGDGAPPCAPYVPPAYAALPVNPKLPDPFLSANGARITHKDEWACRRAEIGAQAQAYELGPEPGKPASVTGSSGGSSITVTVSNSAGKTISFSAPITYPTTGKPPYPAMIGIGGIEIGPSELNAMGVASIIFPNDTIAAEVDASSRGQGEFYDLYGSTHPAGAMMAWAWGVSRLIDAIEQTPAAKIDPGRLGVTGCSRDGKGALVVGAFEERIVLTIPQESGSGGAASWRVSDAQLASGTEVQTLSEITGENVWFRSSFAQFGHTASKLPFDHHMIEGMVAPRALLVIENTSQVWLGDLSTCFLLESGWGFRIEVNGFHLKGRKDWRLPLTIADVLAIPDGSSRRFQPVDPELGADLQLARSGGACLGSSLELPLRRLRAAEGDLVFLCVR